MNATTSSSARAEEARWQSKIYQAIATPVNFITFLISLYLIDSHNRAQRYHQPESKASGTNQRTWLHKLFHQQTSSPYDWVNSYQEASLPRSAHAAPPRHGARGEKDGEAGNWFYRTKQKKLLRAEAANAFAMRDSVLLAMGTLAIFVLWVLWQVVKWLALWVLHQMVLAKVQTV
ncbi:hypothetical protein F5Y08DRAFT_296918 [Xylaria arbuscula]|nr:hypothetical protein F5Y08DRAFT_296918 [Xylaria arbuscula]